MKKNDVRQSKFLSKVLRHTPEKIGIRLDKNGWVGVEELLDACRKHGVLLDRETLVRIVETNDKQRFAFSEDGQKIRANQGHSVPIDLNLEPIEPPERLYHGTADRFFPSIRKKGLIKGNRHHVHLSKNPITARQVGKRHGNPVILQVLAREMYQDGYTFFKSANGIWLTEFVPVCYLREYMQ
ncbi:RNA 2'-phosphotransferase [Thermoflavimicrobium dichotomicum]|uniref:Probable RNA 2'-phosphotransferase n=1 Tax=Thermoflavimicrobium dichotomicum TaxID=46223 RepID=A0A1I3SBG8_9BACL|nr:RNA 2'-phosphotransferase [Thermoflavimicrobium dichotomicum]SFJ54887.1 putative RNA 2'-phosphotransferase [Thermoflavimicrobium dichotomicum]